MRKVLEIANVFEFVFFAIIISNVGGEFKIVFQKTFLPICSNLLPYNEDVLEKSSRIPHFINPLL